MASLPRTIVFLTTLFPVFALCSSTLADTFRPYTATYQAHSTEIPFKITARRRLHVNPDTEQAILTSDAKAIMTRVTETSRLSTNSCSAKPLEYQYTRNIFGKKQKHQHHFNWEAMNVRYQANNSKANIIPFSEPISDRLQAHFNIRCAVKAGLLQFSFPVISKNSIKTHLYQVEPTILLNVPYGKIKAIPIKRIRENSQRATHIWLAKELDYVIAQYMQKKGKETNTLALKQLDFL